MENQEVNETPSVEFLSDEQVQNIDVAAEGGSFTPPDVIDIDAAREADQQAATAPAEEVIDNTENTQQTTQTEEPVDVDAEVLSYLSEKLGRQFSSFDDLVPQQQESVLDERVEAIAKFVQETGRDPQDWFRYQQLDASEMDDMTAVRIQMVGEYDGLSQDELDTLLSSKYKLDPNLHTEEEVRLSKLQLKLDAKTAKDQIEKLREKYAAPLEEEQQDYESPITEDWVYNMAQQLDELKGIEFDLPSGETFTFGLTDQYKVELGEKNVRLDEYFDSYVRKDGSWDYDKLNMHRSVIDNIDTIVQSVYKQGMADGQRGIVNKAANVSTNSPNQGVAQPESSPLADQLRNALGLNRGFGSNS